MDKLNTVPALALKNALVYYEKRWLNFMDHDTLENKRHERLCEIGNV